MPHHFRPPLYRVCSGQSARRAFGSGSRNDWGICLNDELYNLCPWWRAEDGAGRRRTFPTHEAGERARLKLERQGVDERLKPYLVEQVPA